MLLNDIVHFGAIVVNRMRLEKYNNLGEKKTVGKPLSFLLNLNVLF